MSTDDRTTILQTGLKLRTARYRLYNEEPLVLKVNNAVLRCECIALGLEFTEMLDSLERNDHRKFSHHLTNCIIITLEMSAAIVLDIDWLIEKRLANYDGKTEHDQS